MKKDEQTFSLTTNEYNSFVSDLKQNIKQIKELTSFLETNKEFTPQLLFLSYVSNIFKSKCLILETVKKELKKEKHFYILSSVNYINYNELKREYQKILESMLDIQISLSYH